MKIKVLFFLFSLGGGGAERTVINILNNIDKERFEVVLVLGKSHGNDYINLLNRNIKIKILNCSKLRFTFLRLRNTIIKEKPDLLFSTINANNIILILARILTFKNIPLVIREASNRTESGKVTKLNKLITFLLYNIIPNEIIALSKGVKEDLINNFRVKESKITVIYNPVEVDEIVKQSNEKVTDFKREENEKIILSVGRLAEAKDHATLLKAFALVLKSVNAKLIILGKGPLEARLKKLNKTLGIEDKVIFLGFKKNPYKYMRDSDVFVLSSKWEGFGHVIVEAMVTGTPVISTDCKSGPREIIGDNESGLLVPIENPYELSRTIIELLSNPQLACEYSNKGKKRAKDFEAKTIIQHYESLFNKVFEE